MGNLAVRGFAFQGNPVRCVGTAEAPWFVAKDVAKALGISWSGATLANIKKEWTGVMKLNTPVRKPDGTYRVMENEVTVVNEAAVYKLAFRSNKPEADAFTNWVASEVLPSIRKTGEYRSKRRVRYERQGKPSPWIEVREQGIETRKEFTATLVNHDVTNPGIANCTNVTCTGLFGGTVAAVKDALGLSRNESLRDNLSRAELGAVLLAEAKSQEEIETLGIRGNLACAVTCEVTSQSIGNTLKGLNQRVAMLKSHDPLLPPPANPPEYPSVDPFRIP